MGLQTPSEKVVNETIAEQLVGWDLKVDGKDVPRQAAGVDPIHHMAKKDMIEQILRNQPIDEEAVKNCKAG